MLFVRLPLFSLLPEEAKKTTRKRTAKYERLVVDKRGASNFHIFNFKYLLGIHRSYATTSLSSSSSSSSSSLSMERKKSRSRGSVDELALAKAAAWAWHERGSGSEGKLIREFNVTRTPRAPGPSRYKQEAIKLAQLAKVKDEKEREKQKENSLLDPYEVHMISRQLDRFAESSRFYDSNYTGFTKVGLHHEHWNYDTPLPESERSGGRNTRKKKKKSLGFWQKHGVMCGTRGDVVEATVFREARSRQNKDAPVVRSDVLNVIPHW